MIKLNKLKIIFSVMIVTVILASFTISVSAAVSSVTFVGGADKMVFVPDDTDLFQNFKNVMPGETIEQKITIKNDSRMRVKIYLKAEPVEEKYVSFLENLTLEVVSSLDNETIFSAHANETAGLTDYRLLGTFLRQGQLELTVKLTVPLSLSNEFRNTRGEIVWFFYIEDVTQMPPIIFPDPTPSITLPPTTTPPTTTPPTTTPPTTTPPTTTAPTTTPPTTTAPTTTPPTTTAPTTTAPTTTTSPDYETSVTTDDYPWDSSDGDKDKPGGVQTGDTSNVLMWSVLLGVFISALAIMIAVKIKADRIEAKDNNN